MYIPVLLFLSHLWANTDNFVDNLSVIVQYVKEALSNLMESTNHISSNYITSLYYRATLKDYLKLKTSTKKNPKYLEKLYFLITPGKIPCIFPKFLGQLIKTWFAMQGRYHYLLVGRGRGDRQLGTFSKRFPTMHARRPLLQKSKGNAYLLSSLFPAFCCRWGKNVSAYEEKIKKKKIVFPPHIEFS